MRESSVPILSGGKAIGFLLTGEVATRKPKRSRFSGIAQQLNGAIQQNLWVNLGSGRSPSV